MRIHHIIITVLSFLALSCERDTNIDLPKHESKLVTYALLEVGERPEIHVTKSYSLSEKLPENVALKDAKVELLSGGNSLGLLSYAEETRVDTTYFGEIVESTVGFYTSNSLQVEAGKDYEVQVSHSSHSNITAKTIVGSLPVIQLASLEQNVAQRTDADGFTEAQSLIHLDLQIPAGANNYYRVALNGETTFTNVYDPDFPEIIEPVSYASLGPAEKEGNYYKAMDPWFSSEGKGGQTIRVSFLVNLYAYDDQGGITERDFESLEVVLYSLNTDGKTFIDTFDRQLDAEELADIPIFPRESVVVYGNVENGYGIVGEMSRVAYTIK